jgi:hypothetical protein
MSKRDYITARSLTLRDAADPANRAKVEAYSSKNAAPSPGTASCA